ncbi:MAG: hypothetical protein E7Z93_08670 [Cyanobacteria bacterium SIG32]|nr:hypothetical protein [Cyanobacteria bacterium SIG32]
MEQNEHEKMSVAPGIVKGGYGKPKARTSNPTMQAAVQELPTVEKSVMYREYYATTLSFATSMPMNGEFSMEFITEVAPVSKAPVEAPYKKIKRVDKVEPTPQLVEEMAQAPEIPIIQMPPEMVAPQPQIIEEETSDMEMAMNYMNSAPQEVRPPEVETEAVDIEIPITPIENVPKSNVFGDINAMQNATAPKPRPTVVTKEEFKDEKPFMVVDKIEVRRVEDAEGNSMYMIGKEICDHNKFETFKQEVAGKILAMDCKRLELHGVTYTKQRDGVYINSDNDVVTMDDLLDILHG